MSRRFISGSLVLAALALANVVGCDRGTPPGPASNPGQTSDAQPPARGEDAHAHKAGAHGGNVVEIGRDNYHAEAVSESGGALRLYLLGRDEARVLEVEPQTLTAYAKPEGATDAAAITFNPDPQTDDAKGKTSRFLAKLPADLAGKPLEVTVPNIRIAGERFRFSFSTVAAGHDDGLPPKVAGAEEKALYLTPGGKYTEADIKANGGVTASEKFRGEKASHNLKARPGEPVCPVTLTKANAKFTWVVGGKAYQFCCPPCVDEFVTLAKEHPEQIKEPEEYQKR